MKTRAEVADYTSQAKLAIVYGCKQCAGRDPNCACREMLRVETEAYEACVPRDFWKITPDDIHHNRKGFDEVVRPYCDKLRVARAKGYGLLLLGDNGVGKTTFMSYVLTRAISIGFTAFYTTLPQLDYEMKRGFRDSEAASRLREMLTSDFLALDEMGKESFKDGDSYMRTQVERVLKDRYDDGMPTVIATNASVSGLKKIYGATLASLLVGKYQIVVLQSGDYRKQMREQMEKDLGL
ncbi:hypothetical protein LCGC14_1233760 [marine sediment metagenome]|uniref:IstB-like ATP-binding domain-containing protein n=1 Tax=marine sediment metagenome TaxID=412755 RepID=A0A0F9LBX8_9ZZZZ